MVDEFQDTNRVQLELIERLRGPETRLFTVGDEHQSIYRFRNADLEVFRAERAQGRELARRPSAAAPRELPLATRGRSAAANALGEHAARGLHAADRRAGTSAGDGPRAELLLTFEEGKGKDHREVEGRGHRPRAAAIRGQLGDRRAGAGAGGAPARAGRRGRGEAGRHRRPAARIHARRRLRGRAAALRPRALRGRRPRLLVAAAGRGPAAPARRGRQPARRRDAVRRAREPGLRGQPRRAVAAARRPTGQRRHVWPTIAAALRRRSERDCRARRTPSSSRRSTDEDADRLRALLRDARRRSARRRR